MKKKRIISMIILLICMTGCNQKQDEVINVYDYYSGDQRENTDNDIIYLWEKQKMPIETIYTENTADYFDNPDFEPYMTVYNVPEGTKVKGAILVSPGGAFVFRSENTEGKEVAQRFAELGYVSFLFIIVYNPIQKKSQD